MNKTHPTWTTSSTSTSIIKEPLQKGSLLQIFAFGQEIHSNIIN